MNLVLLVIALVFISAGLGGMTILNYGSEGFLFVLLGFALAYLSFRIERS